MTNQAQLDSVAIMASYNFNYQALKRWRIYGANSQVCCMCLSPKGKPCLNLADIKKQAPQPRENNTPHMERIDWLKVRKGLALRGYQLNRRGGANQ